jgi:hypothetical protein
MFFLPEGHVGETWGDPKSIALLEIWEKIIVCPLFRSVKV